MEPSNSLQLNPTFNGTGWTVIGSVTPKHSMGVNRVMIQVTSPEGKVVFSVPVYWEVEQEAERRSKSQKDFGLAWPYSEEYERGSK